MVWNESLGFLFWHWALAHLPNYTVKHNADTHTPSVCTSICLHAFKGKYGTFKESGNAACVHFSLWFYQPDEGSDSQIIISLLRLQAHSHAPACLHARPVICQLVALVCLSWHGGQHWVFMSNRALFPFCPEVKKKDIWGLHYCCKREIHGNRQDQAEGRIEQVILMSQMCGCHGFSQEIKKKHSS